LQGKEKNGKIAGGQSISK